MNWSAFRWRQPRANRLDEKFGSCPAGDSCAVGEQIAAAPSGMTVPMGTLGDFLGVCPGAGRLPDQMHIRTTTLQAGSWLAV